MHNLYQKNFSIKPFFYVYVKAIQAKEISFVYSFLESTLIHDFLKCLVKAARIAGYQFLENKSKVNIFLSHDLSKKSPLIPKLTFYSSQGRTKVSSLKKLQNLDKQNPTAFTLVSVNGGVITLKDCLQKKCGGQLLVTLN